MAAHAEEAQSQTMAAAKTASPNNSCARAPPAATQQINQNLKKSISTSTSSTTASAASCSATENNSQEAEEISSTMKKKKHEHEHDDDERKRQLRGCLGNALAEMLALCCCCFFCGCLVCKSCATAFVKQSQSRLSTTSTRNTPTTVSLGCSDLSATSLPVVSFNTGESDPSTKTSEQFDLDRKMADSDQFWHDLYERGDMGFAAPVFRSIDSQQQQQQQSSSPSPSAPKNAAASCSSG